MKITALFFSIATNEIGVSYDITKHQKRIEHFLMFREKSQEDSFILICGDRNYPDGERSHKALDAFASEKGDLPPHANLIAAGDLWRGEIDSWRSTGFNFQTPEQFKLPVKQALLEH